MDGSNIMSIRELIDSAFGDPSKNVVNHKLIQTVLVILARQLRLLERRVEVDIGTNLEISSGTSLSITEVKLQANVPRKKKGKGPDAAGTVATETKGGTEAKGATETKGGTEAKGAKGKGTPATAKVAAKASAASYDKTSSSATKSTTDKSSTEKSSTVKSSTEKSSTEKSSTEKSSTEKSSTEKSSTEKSSTAKSSSGLTSSATKSTTEKSSSSKSKGTLETGTAKTSTVKSSTTKSGTDKTIMEKTSTVKTTTEKTSSDISKSVSEVTKSSTDGTKSSDKKTTSSSDETSSSTEPTSTDKTSSSSAKLLPQNYRDLLENIEEQREQELRIIHQRSDSREERDKTPTPIASMDSMEKQYEKLLIVERKSTDAIKAAESQSQAGVRAKTPRLSVVTQEEFAKLTEQVRQLQSKFKIAGVPGFPENAQLLNDLRKGASLTDAMAALQLSARVEAAEGALDLMLTVITEIINQIYIQSNAPKVKAEDLLKKIQSGDESATEIIISAISAQSQGALGKRKSTKDGTLSRMSEVGGEGLETVEGEEKDTVTHEELDKILQALYDECMKMLTSSTSASNNNANSALRLAHRLESRLDESLNLGDRMMELEMLFADYSEKINTLDTGLSSQMTNYQEQLTQMQHELEAGLEAMAEALANTGGDTAAVAELNNRFTSLQIEIDAAAARQKALKDMQNALSLDLQGLWKQIEILRSSKSDRDEVADALKDKAGLGALNGLVSRQEFDAVRGDFEKRIGAAYDKFNNQEIIWQRAIDDLIRELNEKADWIQVVSLQGSINQYLDKFRAKIRDMEEVVGEPRASAVSRKLHRDAECLSCATPAHMDLEEKTIPLLPAFPSSRMPAVGAEDRFMPKEDGDHGGICYPGLPVPHAVDPRAHVCHRYCGGSHTIINNNLSRAPMGMIITPASRPFNTALGTDGKLYMVDEDKVKKPCIPCYKKTTTPEPSEAEPALNEEEFASDMTSFNYQHQSTPAVGASDIVSVTPPPPIEDD